MWLYQPIVLIIVAAVGFGVLPAAADTCGSGDIAVSTLPFTDTGCLLHDQSEQSFVFSLASADTLNLFTTSWATGGFAPVLTLFDPSGAFIATDDGGDPGLDTCGARVISNVDPAGPLCFDAYLMNESLAAGTGYRLVLTEYGNEDNIGSDFVTPEPYAPGNFSEAGGPATSVFESPENTIQMTDVWSVTIEEQAQAQDTTPEPMTWPLLLSGLFLVRVMARGHRATDFRI